jgi:hypothetical protein
MRGPEVSAIRRPSRRIAGRNRLPSHARIHSGPGNAASHADTTSSESFAKKD